MDTERRDRIKDTVSMREIVEVFEDVPQNGMICCPFHKDKTPSMKVYEDAVKCFGCGVYYDIFGFVSRIFEVRDNRTMTFVEIMDWIEEHAGTEEQREKKAQVKEAPKLVPQTWINYWYMSLDPSHRQWLKDKRLLSDKTIDDNLLGYRPDWDAVSIPFWSGLPRQSEIDTVQFRYIDATFRKYGGQKGFYKPSVVNRHVLNPFFVGIFFGTFDSHLGVQDGLPFISTNGSEMFMKGESLAWLRGLLKGVQYVAIVPDTTAQEFTSAQRLANLIGGHVHYFPRFEGKDYTDWRVLGKSSELFKTDVLGVHPMRKTTLDYVFLAEKQALIRSLVETMSFGDVAETDKLITEVYETGIRPNLLAWAVQILTVMQPNNLWTYAQWEDIAHSLQDKPQNPEIVRETLIGWAKLQEERLGVF